MGKKKEKKAKKARTPLNPPDAHKALSEKLDAALERQRVNRGEKPARQSDAEREDEWNREARDDWFSSFLPFGRN